MTGVGHPAPMDAGADPWHHLAEQQQGVVGRSQLLSLGLSRSQARRNVANGRWRLLLPGVYATFTGPVGDLAAVWAAILGAGSGAAASHATALWLSGVIDDRPGLIHVSIPAERRVRSHTGVRIHRARAGIHSRASCCVTSAQPRRMCRAGRERDGESGRRCRPRVAGDPATAHHGEPFAGCAVVPLTTPPPIVAGGDPGGSRGRRPLHARAAVPARRRARPPIAIGSAQSGGPRWRRHQPVSRRAVSTVAHRGRAGWAGRAPGRRSVQGPSTG